ncbi:MAG: hypothetical protein CL840_00325 [Crocinitomicaceae bacterium]|nr:hypothetical protein [Crocinitomicaceae bacterium]|tara:strand:- start:4428 stop:4745 length:318 start_codon:yes stop_codon:yes gene_type:complete
MEEQYFNEIRKRFCSNATEIEEGKMMSFEAIKYKRKVFAFFTGNKKMVFKLGKEFNPDTQDFDINVFNPYVKRAPFNGWFEVPYSAKEYWPTLTEKSLSLLKSEM